ARALGQGSRRETRHRRTARTAMKSEDRLALFGTPRRQAKNAPTLRLRLAAPQGGAFCLGAARRQKKPGGPCNSELAGGAWGRPGLHGGRAGNDGQAVTGSAA